MALLFLVRLIQFTRELPDLFFQAALMMIPIARTTIVLSCLSTPINRLDQFVRLIDVDLQFVSNKLLVTVRFHISEHIDLLAEGNRVKELLVVR